jgi:Uma2 family endonuclease
MIATSYRIEAVRWPLSAACRLQAFVAHALLRAAFHSGERASVVIGPRVTLRTMRFVIDDAFLPATLTTHPMTDEEFVSFCAEHPDLFFEMTADGEIIVTPPTYSLTCARNSRITGRLAAWTPQDGRGIACDSSTGFVLPNGARRSPDAAWTLKSRIAQLDPASRERYWHLSPDFVIELQSSTDRPRILDDKIRESLGAVSISSPLFRMDMSRTRSLAPELKSVCAQIAEATNSRADPLVRAGPPGPALRAGN